MINSKIKFSVQIQPDFINELRGKVKEYFDTNKISKYGNANLVLKTIFMISLYMAPYFLMVTGVITSIPWILFSWMIMGVGMAGVGMGIMHDANHGTYSKNSRINGILSKSLYFLGGFPPNWQYQHNTLHHGFTNIEGHDDDIAPIGFLRFSPHKPLYKIHRYQYFYAWFFYGLMTLSWSTVKDFNQLYKFKEDRTALPTNKSYSQILTVMIIWKIIYYTIFLVIPLLAISISWYWIVLSYCIMHFVSGLILGVIFQSAHVVTDVEFPLPDENGNMENNWAIHQLLTTSDFAPKSRIFSWMIGGLNYQVEHHLFPNISHVHYRKISALVQKTAEKYGLPYHVQPNFFLALSSHAKMLKNLGRY